MIYVLTFCNKVAVLKGCELTRCKGIPEAKVGVAIVPVLIEGVDLMITVLGGAAVTPATTGVLVEVALTGDTRTRRTLPSADTLTSLTGTILAPGGTMWAGRTVTPPPLVL